MQINCGIDIDYYRFNTSWFHELILVLVMRRLGGDEFLESTELLPGTAADISWLAMTLKPVLAALSVRRLPQTRR